MAPMGKKSNTMLDFKPETARAAVDEAAKHLIPGGTVLLEGLVKSLLDGLDERWVGREITIKVIIGEKQTHETNLTLDNRTEPAVIADGGPGQSPIDGGGVSA